MTRARLLAALTALLVLIGVQVVAGAAPAYAAASQLSFVTASPVQTAFGGNWNVQLAARFADTTTVPIPADQATVDVYLSGISAPIASRLPIQPDGSVYVSQSATSTLPPGEYQMTAQLIPISGGYIEATQTTTPLVLNISAYAVDARISVDDASVAAGEPVIEAQLSGQFVDTTEAVPAGTWSFVVTARGKTVMEQEAAQDAGEPDALRYAIPGTLDKGVEYTVAATFTPVEALAAGLEVTQPSKVTFRTQDGGLGDRVPYPLWLLILTCVVPVALAVTVIVLTVRVGKRRVAVPARPQHPDVGPAVVEQPAEPAWDPFASPPAARPEPSADAPTENWTLSQDPDSDGQHLR